MKTHSIYKQKSKHDEVDFPIVCETCLGPNPYVRFQKFPMGGSCHISGRPYTVFRWKAGSEARYKKTVICPEVAKAKNVCQVCMLDIDYNLPVQVRDTLLGISDGDPPVSNVGKEFLLNQIENVEATKIGFDTPPETDLLTKMVRTEPYYKRNQARVCSFFVKGLCNRGVECPYRHEMTTNSELSNQNYHDRYYGIKDPVAEKMLARSSNIPSLSPPTDANITTLFVGSITPAIKKDDINEIFDKFGKIQKIEFLYERNCAFITYYTRQAAETAANDLKTRIVIKGLTLKVRWGKSNIKPDSIKKVKYNHKTSRLQNSIDFVTESNLFKSEELVSKSYGAMDPNQFG